MIPAWTYMADTDTSFCVAAIAFISTFCALPQDMVIVPASSGLMGILPSHAPTVAQLRSGVVEVHDGGEKESYFVSSGFAFVHKDRTDVCAVEAVKVFSQRFLSSA